MEEMKIPQGWGVIELKNKIKILSGYPFDSKFFNNENKGYPLIRIRDLNNGISKTYFNSQFDSSFLVKTDDLLVGMDGEFHVVKWKGSEALLNQRIMRIQAIDGLLVEDLLFYILKIEIKLIENLTPATTVKHLSVNDIKNLKIIVPKSLKEQEKIASILQNIDKNIESTERVIHKQKRIKDGLMDDLLTGRIRIKDGKKYQETEFDEVEGIVKPKEWVVNTLEKLTLKVADRDHTTPKYLEKGVPIISPKDFDELEEISFDNCKFISLEAHNKNYKKTNIIAGDIIFTRIGAGLGKSCLVKEWMPKFSILHSAAMIKPCRSLINSSYLNFYLKTPLLQKQILKEIQSIGVPDLGLDKIKKFKISLPDNLEEQEGIVNVLEVHNKNLKNEMTYLKKLKKTKAGLMEDLLTGRVRVKY